MQTTSSLHVFGAVQLLVSCRWTVKNQKKQNGTSLSFIWTAIWFLYSLVCMKIMSCSSHPLLRLSLQIINTDQYIKWDHLSRTCYLKPEKKEKKKPLKNWTALISIMSQRVKLKYDSFVVKWKPVCVVLCTNNFPASRRALSESWRA